MKKIMFLTGSRGEWGYIRPILRKIQEMDDVDYKLIVTNMHLLPSYGNSYKEIINDGFEIAYKVNMSLDGYSHVTMAKSLAICLLSLPDILENEKPDWLVLAGDRGEQLMGAIAAGYTYTPVCHIQAGEVSGNIDNMARHAIGKFVHIHFASNKDAEERLIRLGEEPFRVFNVGAPQLDELVAGDYSTIKDVEERLSISLQKPFILAVLHPITEEARYAREQAETYIKALNKVEIPKILILPNNDAGSLDIKRAISELREGEYRVFANVKREDYLRLLKECVCIVGNSSSGLLEAPTFRTPAVNIGRRQNLRFQGNNVINCEFSIDEICKAINSAATPEFHKMLNENNDAPYGDGHSSDKILDVLLNTRIDEKLLVKELTY